MGTAPLAHDTEGGIASHPASNGERTIDDVQIGKHRKRRDGTCSYGRRDLVTVTREG